ncbi:amino acid/polyamine transporter I [Lentinula aciculospora]|uniref:Amino acid/polyamine transporter I n=1 Tax=Lentinula aciculospora TaxID=153920 RepID=A0A9W9AN02_9AGAR|nr:amino acid/polyamine transporter I [Lentinula aciculospora]
MSGVLANANDELLLAQLGYKQEFKRDFGVFELFGLAFSIQGVLPSIASVLVYSIPYGGAVSMVWGWTVCSIFLMLIATAIAELGSAAPTSGGVYYWTFHFSSPKYRNYLSWLLGYVDTIAYIAGTTGINWGCAVQVMAAASIGSNIAFEANVFQTYGVFVAITILQATLCSLASKIIARLQLVYILVNLGRALLISLCFAVIFGMPANTPSEFKNDAKYAFGSFENLSSWPDGFAFILGFLAPLWVVGGFDSSVHISEEARNASTAIPWAVMLSTAATCILGWAINLSLAFNMGSDIDGILSNPIGQPLATIFFNGLGQRGTLGLWAILIVAQFMMGTSILVSSSRQIFAFSRDGALPFSNYLYYVNKSLSVPTRCVWFSAAIAVLLALIPLAGNAASGAIFALAVVGQYICYSTAISARWLGGTVFEKGPFHLGVLSFPISLCAVFFMLFMSVILLFPAEPALASPATMNYTVLVIGSVMLFATVYYFFPVYGGIHWFKGPVVTAKDDMDLDGSAESRSMTEMKSREKEI